MSNQLVRTTTYFDPNLLNLAKKRAIDEGKSLYELINEGLKIRLNLSPKKNKLTKKCLSYEKLFPVYELGSSHKKICRKDAYEKKGAY